jgi:D-sedoheptulose 7-phosphate isomerase
MAQPTSMHKTSHHNWKEHVDAIHALLQALEITDGAGHAIPIQDGFKKWEDATLSLREHRGTVFLIGNGASASMASHMAADLAKNAHLHTEVFFDVALITAISNDLGYDKVFSEPLSRRCNPNDILVAISSSGNSPNVLSAVNVANKHGLMVVSLTAMAANNPLRRAGSLNLYVPADTYSKAESCHASILHHWMDMVEIKDSKP